MVHEATRTLVKSPPEVWAQCSDAEALERHLNGSFGEIRVTRLEPERQVAWEGEQVSGTVVIEPSAWGTRVTLTAELEREAEPEPEAVEEPEAVVEELTSPEEDPSPNGRGEGFLARWRSRFRGAAAVPEPEPAEVEPPVPAPDPEPEAVAVAETEAPVNAPEVLSAALESLGQAHHRPFSRS